MIIYKRLIVAISLFGIILASLSYAAIEEATAVFTYGKIEVLKTGEEDWRFLKKNTVLTARDVVRMPPFSLIRLKTVDGVFLPTLSGGRELPVNVLIDEGFQRRDAAKGRRINGNYEGNPSIDVLPLGDPRTEKDRRPTSDKTAVPKVSYRELEGLRLQLDSLPEEIAVLLPPSLHISAERRNVTPLSYPAPNLDLAQKLYEELNTIQGEVAAVPRSLLYAQILRYAHIDADLLVAEDGELAVIFDSGVPPASVKKVTANQQLIHRRTGEDTLWVSIQIQSPQRNFTTAWYKAAQASEPLSR